MWTIGLVRQSIVSTFQLFFNTLGTQLHVFLRLILSTTDISEQVISRKVIYLCKDNKFSVIAINLWLKRKENKETVWGFEPQVSKMSFLCTIDLCFVLTKANQTSQKVSLLRLESRKLGHPRISVLTESFQVSHALNLATFQR